MSVTGSESWWIGACIAFAALCISAATLWNGSRGATVSLLSAQVEAMRAELVDLRQQLAEQRRHTERCEQRLNDFRDQNEWLMDRLRQRDRMPPRTEKPEA